LPYAAGMTGLLLVAALLNPFGLGLNAETESKALWQKLLAPYYGTGPERDVGRQAITVVLLDDSARREMSRAGPFNAMAIAQMIEDIAFVPGGGRPAAIFVDLLLGDLAPPGLSAAELQPLVLKPEVAGKAASLTPTEAAERAAVDACNGNGEAVASPFRCLLIRVAALTKWQDWQHKAACTVDAAAKLRCIRAAGGIPIIFADPGPANDPVRGALVPEGQKALDSIALTATVRVDVEKGYPLGEGGAPGRDPLKLSAAALLYADFCDRIAVDQGREDCLRLLKPGQADKADICRCAAPPWPRAVNSAAAKPAVWSDRYRRRLDVVWGEGVRSEFTDLMAVRQGLPATPCSENAEAFCKIAAYECTSAPPGLRENFAAFRAGLTSGVNIDPTVSAIDRRCLHTHWLSFALFEFLSARERSMAFDHRMVLIGGSLSNDNDVVAAGPLGGLPGVFYHAMALDNLVRDGADYATVATPILPLFDATGTDMANLLLVFVTTLITAMVMHWLAEHTPELRSPRFWLQRLALLLAICMGVLGMLYGIARMGPVIPNGFNIAALLITGLACIKDIAMRMIEPARTVAVKRWRWLGYLSLDGIGKAPKSTAAGDG
jgi:hypothetical protein